MNTGKVSLRAKAIMVVTAFLLVTSLLLGTALAMQSRQAMKTLIDERMLDIVNTAADMLDGNTLRDTTEQSLGTDEYQRLFDTLYRFKSNIGLKFIYAVREDDDGSFIFVADPAEEEASAYGDLVHVTDALVEAGNGTAAVDDTPYTDSFGRFYSAYSPVFDASGKVAGVVAADFEANWYEDQVNRNTFTIVAACIVFTTIGIGITLVLTRQYNNQLEAISTSLNEFSSDLDAMLSELPKADDAIPQGNQTTAEPAPQAVVASAQKDDNGMQALGAHIAALHNSLREYISHANTQANNMITAMASDYRSVYYVNLDMDDAVCYRADPNDKVQTAQGIHFPYHERFLWYADNCVVEAYRDGFKSFIEPNAIREALETQPIIAYRYLVTREGQEYYEMIRMAGVRRAEDRDDGVVHAIGLGLTVIDAEMREALAKNEALAEALAMADEANRAKTAFLSSMSHEIRTPMNAIIGLIALALQDETLTDQTREYLQKTSGSAHHLLGLINDILDMSRIESGRMLLRSEEFSLSAMIDQINTMVMAQCNDKGLTYECRILNQMDDRYIGDDMKLKEVILNILSNAIKFTDEPGSVTLSVERTAVFEGHSTLRFSIKDTGVGMDESFIPKIFDPFAQEDSTRKNKYGSTGLGMAITKNIVEMMNGTITVESQKGVGTEFVVAVTLGNCEGEGHGGQGDIDLSDMRVLVVDDDAMAAEHARVVLDEAGIRTDVCASGEDALRMLEVQHLKLEPYNLVLMDWKMPSMDGVDAAQHVREHYSNETAVIVITAYDWTDIEADALASGVDGFVAKPITSSNVIAEFERIARRNNSSLLGKKQQAELAGRHLLLAEDIEINAEILMEILSLEDIETDHAENGQEAVDMFSRHEPGTYDAILMDVRMPVMDGLEAAAAIRALDRIDAQRVPIIALTANAFDEDVQQSLQAGMNAHLTKPVEPDHLFQTLAELIWEYER